MRPRHWLAFFAKIWSVSQRWTTARSTARGSPPATDMWAPKRGMNHTWGPPSGGPVTLHRAELLLDDAAAGIQTDDDAEEVRRCGTAAAERRGHEAHVAPAHGRRAVGGHQRARGGE